MKTVTLYQGGETAGAVSMDGPTGSRLGRNRRGMPPRAAGKEAL